jgi:hypothetical protein
MTRLPVLALVLLTALIVSPLIGTVCIASAAQHAGPAEAPVNIRVAPVLLPVFDALIAASPTFSAQCDRITGATYVRVVVTPVLGSSTTSRGTARTTIRRFASGALIASVEMPVPLTTFEYADLFGHEFEHIVEQIDRVDLPAMSASRGGATRLSDGAYETIRARKVGRAIADESERSRATAPDTPPTHNGAGDAIK